MKRTSYENEYESQVNLAHFNGIFYISAFFTYFFVLCKFLLYMKHYN